jgi:hypothetical protein
VDVATNDSGDTSGSTDYAHVRWFHEVLDLGTQQNPLNDIYHPSNNTAHYEYYNKPTNNTNNFHYVSPNDRFQLLPLITEYSSATGGTAVESYVGTTPVHSYSPGPLYVTLTAPVCHGMSGSGAFRISSIGNVLGLLGPAVSGPARLNGSDSLCENFNLSASANGFALTSFVRPSVTRAMLAPYVLSDR